MDVPQVPNYVGRGLVNLVAEIEHRLTGAAPSPTLDPDLADSIPSASTCVLVLFDGLGAHQLNHPNAHDLAAATTGVLDAPFPATTTVSLATVATGLPPSQHGLIAYKMWMPDIGSVVNTIHMTTPIGEPIPDLDAPGLLPSPNLWERLNASGIEPVVIQPGNFASTPSRKRCIGAPDSRATGTSMRSPRSRPMSLRSASGSCSYMSQTLTLPHTSLDKGPRCTTRR